MNAKVLNSIGLFLGIMGAIFLFIWAPPQPNLNEGLGMQLENGTPIDSTGKTVEQYNNEVRSKAKYYKRQSNIGLIMIFFSFLLQLVAVWIYDLKRIFEHGN